MGIFFFRDPEESQIFDTQKPLPRVQETNISMLVVLSHVLRVSKMLNVELCLQRKRKLGMRWRPSLTP